ncbi:TrbG/VirB9 family P-type conjugative transfer protein [Noviherbaspirillum sp.]|jgi:type IV secretion system protein VirB9|uniref:TrbG/VirB9 family P-type conjugative transfer protein n=1 Tax=Noviherbaspirillum sp. TaxID=1926288 RepID=UPI0025EA3639|nr:TrbG/VirB9 family P-type conjugative transfer protein [Noviherbaspirillum sp.]
MNYLFLAGVALSIASGVAHSAETSTMFEEKGGNKRIEHIQYSENKVIKIAAVVNHPFLIEFKSDDPIEEVAGGEIAGWDVQKKGSRLYIRALDNAEDTTLLVTSHSRSYVFDLVKAKATAKNIARLRSKIVFDYPPPAPTHSLAETSPSPVRRNENYSMQVVSESTDIRPRDVFDDGRFTWFKFSENGEIPAIYKSQPNTKDEVLIGSHMEGDYVVMHAVSPLWNLRLGESMIGIFNDSFDAQGVGPEGGTTVRGFVREIKK